MPKSAMPRAFNKEMLEGFYRERERDLGIDNEKSAEEIWKNEVLRCELVTQLYAYYHYLKADYHRNDELHGGVSLKGQGKLECESVSGIFETIDEEGAEEGFDILITLSWKPGQTPTDFRKELTNRYKNCCGMLNGLAGKSSNPGVLERRLRSLGFVRLDVDKLITVRFLVDVSPTASQRATIQKQLDHEPPIVETDDFVRMDILYADDIEYEVSNTAAAFQFVPHGELELDQADNLCTYSDGDCTAAFVNIRAVSLQALWRNAAKKGLLAQNLRYYVKQATVDDPMCQTMYHKPKYFWYFNNGLTIVCKSFKPKGRRLCLEDFSIVNGGQTTHNIGEAKDLPYDFVIPCKIISMESPSGRRMNDEERINLIADICIATNSQKVVKSVDMVANSKEIRGLRKALKEDKASSICLLSKKGEVADKKAFPLPWQIVRTDRYGQALLSFLYQAPCTARNKTKTLFTDAKLREQLFALPPPPVPFVRDLLRLRWAIHEYRKSWQRIKKTAGRLDASSEQWQRYHLVNNGEFLFLACVGVLCKLVADPRLVQRLKETDIQDCSQLLNRCDVTYPFLKGEDTDSIPGEGSALFRLLDHCLSFFILPGYRAHCENTGKSGDYSAFAKSDRYYLGCVQRMIIKRVQDGYEEADWPLLNEVLREPEGRECADIEAMLKAHPTCWSLKSAETEKDLVTYIYEQLQPVANSDGRPIARLTKEQIRKAIKKYSKDNLDLEGVLCDPEQIKVYGEKLIMLIEEGRRMRADRTTAQSMSGTNTGITEA